MNNEEKNEILELLSESLRKHDRTADDINDLKDQMQKLIDVQVTQTEIMRRMADDINDMKNKDISIDDLEKRVTELEKYTGKK